LFKNWWHFNKETKLFLLYCSFACSCMVYFMSYNTKFTQLKFWDNFKWKLSSFFKTNANKFFFRFLVNLALVRSVMNFSIYIPLLKRSFEWIILLNVLIATYSISRNIIKFTKENKIRDEAFDVLLSLAHFIVIFQYLLCDAI